MELIKNAPLCNEGNHNYRPLLISEDGNIEAILERKFRDDEDLKADAYKHTLRVYHPGFNSPHICGITLSYDREQVLTYDLSHDKGLTAAILEKSPDSEMKEFLKKTLEIGEPSLLDRKKYEEKKKTIYIQSFNGVVLRNDGHFIIIQSTNQFNNYKEPKIIREDNGGERILTNGLRYCGALKFINKNNVVLLHALTTGDMKELLPPLIKKSKKYAGGLFIKNADCYYNPDQWHGSNPYLDIARESFSEFGIIPFISDNISGSKYSKYDDRDNDSIEISINEVSDCNLENLNLSNLKLDLNILAKFKDSVFKQ